MRKSENFDLNLYEGTDIFNPLTTDVPNYEKIDAQMEKNYNLSVGKATELKTGTVHALTRENADCPMIHFTATSNFTSNDTFTVDGVQVSALLVDGSTLPTNCYIIGSEVICYLKGTLLTFFLSGSVSKDSEKLGGELPVYYAKQVDVEQLETTVNSMGEIVEKNANDIIEVNNSLNPDYSRYTFKQYKSGLLPTINATERVNVLITVNVNYNGTPLILYPVVNNVSLAHAIGGGRSMSDGNIFSNVCYSETIMLGKGDVLTFSTSGSLSNTSSVTIGILPYK